MKVFNVLENFEKNKNAASFFYVGCIMAIYALLNFVDPATYSAEIRKDRAEKRYNEAQSGKTTNSLTSSDYNSMQSAFDDIQNAEESPIQFYVIMLIMGGGAGFVCYRVLDRS